MRASFFSTAAVLGAALIAPAAAQTFTGCNPLNSTCPEDPALGTTYASDFNRSMSQLSKKVWNVTDGANNIGFADNGTSFSIMKRGNVVNAQSMFYIFWGQVEILMQAAAGQGIISTMTLLSDDLDEIDWEIMGGNHTHVETNYYGHGNLSQRFAEYHPCDNPQGNFHNYTIDWQQDKITWLLNSVPVRTVPYAPSGLYPQTPSFIKMGIWAAGASSSQGTVDWAGGPTDFSQAPFSMYVHSIRITDGSTNTTSYAYKGNSGSFDSIEKKQGVSKVATDISKPDTSVYHKFSGLSLGAKIAIAVASVAFVVVLLGIWSFCWRRQLKTARDKRRDAENNLRMQQEAQGNYQMAYANQMKGGAFSRHSQIYG